MGGPEVLRSPAQAERHIGAWRELAADVPWSSYFTTPDWQLTWWEVLGRARAGRLALWPGPEGLDAVVGLAVDRLHPRLPGGTGPFVPLGSGAGAADHLGWLVRPHRRGDVRRWLDEETGRRTVLLPATDPESGTEDLLPALEPVATTPCPRVTLEEPLPTGSSGLRKAVRRDERRLADDGVTFRWVPTGEVTAATFDDLLRLHATRADEQGWATSFTGDRRQFHLALVERAGPGCGPAAVVARRVDQVVGVLYGFRWRDTFCYYQTGWDQAYARRGLGTVLVSVAMREAHRDGCTLFDFLRGAESYKYRFGATDRDDLVWLRGRGPMARVLRSRHGT